MLALPFYPEDIPARAGKIKSSVIRKENHMAPTLKDLVKSESDNILQKAILRTALFAEKFYPAPAADTRDQIVKDYEANFYDNPKAAQYGNDDAADVFMALKGISEYELNTTDNLSVDFARAVCIVPQNTPHFEWPEDDEVKVGKTYICIHQGNGAFMDADGNRVHISPSYGLGFRPATDDEMKAVIAGLMATRPASFINNLGDALVNVDLGS